MRILLSATCSVLLLACHSAQAGDSKPDASPAKAAAQTAAKPGAKPAAKPGPVVDTKQASGASDAADSKVYVPKQTVFAVSASDHNPFWPIGWIKTESLPVNAVAATIPHADDFTVTSILLNEPPMAVINGKEMAEGEVAAVPVNGQPVMVQLMAVQDGRVILRWQNQNLIVPLRRNEDLSTLVPDQPLAGPR